MKGFALPSVLVSTARDAQEMSLPLPNIDCVNPVLQLSENSLQRRECLHCACFEESQFPLALL